MSVIDDVVRSPRPEQKVARKLKRMVGEQQLRLCPSIISDMRVIAKRTYLLSQGQAMKKDEIELQTKAFRERLNDLQKLSRQHANWESLQYLYSSMNAIEEAVHGRALSSVAAAAVKDSCEVEESEDQQLELCLSLICAVEAVMRKQLFVMRSSTVRRDKIEQLQQTCRGMVVELQSLTRRHDDVDCVGDTRQDLNAATTALKYARIPTSLAAKIEDRQPIRCTVLIGAMHALMKRKMSLAAGKVMKREEIVKIGREAETLRQTFELLAIQHEHTKNEAVTYKDSVLELEGMATQTNRVDRCESEHVESVMASALHSKEDSKDVLRSTTGVIHHEKESRIVDNPLSDWRRPPTIDELSQLSRLIAPQWKEIASSCRPYPIESHHIADIEFQYPRDLSGQSVEFLESWLKQHGRKATVGVLCESLMTSNCRLPAEEVFGEELVAKVAVDMNEVDFDQNMCESTDYQLFELAKSVGSDWQELAVILGERAVDIECIQKDIPTTRERAFRMLRGWYMRCGKRASLDNVRSKIDKIRGAKQAEEKARAIFPNNFRDDRRFYGRENEVDQMRECLLEGDIHLAIVSPAMRFRLLIIRGHGGIGKSSLAERFAVMFKDVYRDGVFLFNAESWPMLHISVRENMAELSVTSHGGGLDEDNKIFMREVLQKSKVLLVYDSANDLDLINRVLPRSSSQLHVLVTTRCSSAHDLFKRADKVITLDYLSLGSAVVALFGWAERQCPHDGDELEYARKMVMLSFIRRLPLAIAHIGTFARLRRMSFGEYYGLLKSQEEELNAAALDIDKLLQYFRISNLRGSLSEVGVSHPNQLQKLSRDKIEYVTDNPRDRELIRLAQYWMKESNHVYLTWQFDIDSVSEKSPDAKLVLEFASLMASRNIPGDVLQKVAFPDRGLIAASRFSLAIMDLSSHTLITTVETNEKYSCDVHALVQTAVFHRLIRQADDVHLKLTSLSQLLLQIMPVGQGDIHRSLNKNEFLELIPHIYSVAEKILMTGCQNEACYDLVENACWTALEAHHVDVTCHLFEKQLDMVETLCHDRNAQNIQRYVIALIQIGQSCFDSQQNPSVAQSYLTRALQLIEGMSSEDRLLFQREHGVVLNALAFCYETQQQFSDAERLYLNQLSALNSSPNSNRRDIITVMNNLALLYSNSGQVDYAINMYQQALYEAQSVAGTEILSSTMMSNLAECLIQVGDCTGAVGILEKALAVMREWRPGDHDDVANVLRLLSRCHEAMGDLPKATRMAEESLSIVKSTHDPHHPLVALFSSQVALCCHSAGDVDKAIRLAKQGVEILRKKQQQYRDNLCSELNNLGAYYSTKGMLKESFSAREECLALRRSFLPELHPQIAMALSQLGSAYKKAGDVSKSMELYRESLSILEHEHNLPASTDTAEVLSYLAECFRLRGQWTECLPLLLKSHDVISKVCPVSKMMRDACFRLGACYLRLSNLRESEEAFSAAVRISKTVLPPGHPDITAAEGALQKVWQRMRGY